MSWVDVGMLEVGVATKYDKNILYALQISLRINKDILVRKRNSTYQVSHICKPHPATQLQKTIHVLSVSRALCIGIPHE